MTDSTWLPNLVGGTSMWRLASDLNEAKFFDGRLLIPETEGSESLPVTVRWDLTGLIPLAEARAKHPEDTAAAIKDFQAALERVAKVFSTPNSGFDKYKEAFTVPSLDADGGGHYFYSPSKKKLFVTNWGASPRSMGGKAEYVFGFEDWAKQWSDVAPAAAGGAAAAAVVEAADAPKPDEAKKDEEAKKDAAAKEKKKDDKKGRPWWFWPLFALIAIALVLLALFLLKACEDQQAKEIAEAGLPDGAVRLADGAVLLADGAIVSLDAALAPEAVDAAADAAAADAGDGGDAGALADGGDAGDAGADAGKKKHKDGGVDGGDDDDDDDDDSGGTLGGGGGGGGGGTVIVKTFPGSGGTGKRTSVHRKHYSDEAVHWRVSGATSKISRTEDSGHRFDVWLNPGQTFEGVKVEWQDTNGKWHVH